MVDSAIGGKTGINHQSGKNRIGAFYQPEAVICDVNFLSTLPAKEWFCGLGEILKYACISDVQIFDEVSTILKENPQFEAIKWAKIIEKSAAIKADIVSKDEKEMGIRAFLNFGHTFAHAIEHELGYGVMSHGDAVFWGCLAACELSRLEGATLYNHLESFIPLYKPRAIIPESVEKLVQAMYADKKNKSAEITFVLLNAYEQPFTGKVADLQMIFQAWNYMLNLMR
jgi:3-dehydroquinate synthase